MTPRTGFWIALVATVALAIGWIALNRGGDTSERESTDGAKRSPAAAPGAELAPDQPRAQAAGKPERGRTPRDPEARAKLAAAIERARATRQQSDKPAAAATNARPVPEPLAIANKTGSNTDWEKRQLEVLGELIGECYDLAKVDEPQLAGALGITFSIAAEPEVGGLVSNIDFMADYSTIESASMRECTRESLYALELDPPPDGLQVDRQLTLRLGE